MRLYGTTTNVPWDETTPDVVEADCNCYAELKRRVTLRTGDFTERIGGSIDVDWKSVYSDDHLDPEELLIEMSMMLRKCLDSLSAKDQEKARHLIEEADEWFTESFHINEV